MELSSNYQFFPSICKKHSVGESVTFALNRTEIISPVRRRIDRDLGDKPAFSCLLVKKDSAEFSPTLQVIKCSQCLLL